jgi:PAS domain S-box-containing protein
LDYCEQSKKKLYVMYGQTEATARMSYVPPHKLRDKIDSIGISVSGGALEVLSDVGVALSPHERGEIVYTGPNVSLGYAEKISDLNLDDTLDGKLYTGDVGYRDEDGFFFVVGRNKRFAKVFGWSSFKIIYMNQKARERIGWELDEWHKKKTSDFISAVWQDQLAEIVLELVKGPEKMHVLETIDKYGTPLEISINLVEPEGEKPRVLARYRDISEQKKADKAKNEFVSIVSHELRTPLTSIKGALGLMSAGKLGDLRPEVAMLLSIAERNTDRLTVLINDLLDISKIDAGKMEFVVGPVNLTQLVDDALCVASALETPVAVNAVIAAGLAASSPAVLHVSTIGFCGAEAAAPVSVIVMVSASSVVVVVMAFVRVGVDPV